MTNSRQPSFKKVKNSERLFQEVARQIEQHILEGELKPGEMLPPERILGEQFGVSRTVIREALKALELSGLVEVQHGRGAVVLKPTASSVSTSMVRYLKIQESPVWALHELRSILEVEVAGLAAERAQEEDIARLREALKRMRANLKNPLEYLEADLDFHQVLCEASHNPLLPVVLQPFVALMRESRQIGSAASNAPRRSIASHNRILKAIENRDSDAARTEMRLHFENVATFLTEGESRRSSHADLAPDPEPANPYPAGD